MDISNKITENQYRSIVESSMVAIGILTLSRLVSKNAYQDGWISVILGGIYPIIVVLSASFIDRKMNGCSFENINNKVYGKLLSKIILIAFSMRFIFSQATVIAGFTNVAKVVIVSFMSPYLIIFIVFLITLYTAINGLTLVGRLCELVSYLLIVLIIMMIAFSFGGNIINVRPFFSSIKNIISAVPNSLYSYTGIELSYIVISFITNKNNTKKAGLQGVLFIIFTYASNVFVIIYCLGWEITSKNSYPILYLAATLEIPIIENLRTILMIIWTFIIFRILVCYLFGAGYCLSKAFNMKYKASVIITLILSSIGSLFMLPEYNRVDILDKVTPYATAFGILWGVITSIIIVIKNKKASNNSYKKED
ncbi:GerAB/ArcD/ProY family transporter [Clostridium peptidivorans]|uniref:GerAB/ArcD/ProY family transporter n=1 Tax=Clostridium peptidivorans TaxID=100174 RepID=UPI000BE428A6|nr:endospore germination permease [Clostridium peptidivorans]